MNAHLHQSFDFDAFRKPSGRFRPAPLWSWNDRLDEAECRRQVREMADKGLGGFFMHPRVGFMTPYLSEEWMGIVRACAEEAAASGIDAWLYDEDRFPSGFAGGRVPLKNEAFRCRALLWRPKGTAREYDRVLARVSHGGADYELCAEVAPLGKAWFNGATYTDLMNPEAMREFLTSTHERYREACGDLFGKTIPGVFTDEPHYLANSEFDALAVPWTDRLPEEFRRRKGYDLLERLPALFLNLPGYRRTRFDFYDVASALFRESFTQQYYEWCQKNGMIFTGHFQSEETLRLQVQWTGDVMAHYPHMTWPGIDKLYSDVKPVVMVKQLTSVTDQLGKERAFCESFGIMRADAAFRERKRIGDWLLALGINFIDTHLCHYSLRGERKRDCQPDFYIRQPWWEDEGGFSDYVARACAALTGGQRVADILVIQPLTSVWCEYSPLQWDSEYAPVDAFDKPFADLSQRLMENHLDFHYGNETILAEHGAVEGDRLRVGRHAYRLVIVPPVCNLRSTTLDLLLRYQQAGGRVAVIGPNPVAVDGVETDVSLPGAIRCTRVVDAIEAADRLFPDRLRVEERLTGGPATTVFAHSRRQGDSVVHFLANSSDERDVQAVIRIPDAFPGPWAILDPATGGAVAASVRNGMLEVEFATAGSLMLLSGPAAGKISGEAETALLGSGVTCAAVTAKEPAILLDRFTCTPLEENVARLDAVILELNGKRVYEGPVCGVWPLFYGAKDGTPFRATYMFESDLAADGCFAAIDTAENLGAIHLNGKKLKPLRPRGAPARFDPAACWKDLSPTRVPLPLLAVGRNVLVLEGKKVSTITEAECHRLVEGAPIQTTELEEVYLCGRFRLHRAPHGTYRIMPYEPPAGRNLSAEGFPFYCGRVKLSAEFTVKSRPGGAVVELHDLRAASARVSVNGKPAGVLRWPPYRVDASSLLKTGPNQLEIELATTMYNAFGTTRMAGSPMLFRTHRLINNRGAMLFMLEHRLAEFGLESATIQV